MSVRDQAAQLDDEKILNVSNQQITNSIYKSPALIKRLIKTTPGVIQAKASVFLPESFTKVFFREIKSRSINLMPKQICVLHSRMNEVMH